VNAPDSACWADRPHRSLTERPGIANLIAAAVNQAVSKAANATPTAIDMTAAAGSCLGERGIG
jgi:hypothetical protein